MIHDTLLCSRLSRVLICGLGSIGRRHLRLLVQNWPHLHVGTLRSGLGPACDEAELVRHRFTRLDEALAWSPQAAIIATPASDHLSKALPLARLGVPLLIEKPVGSGHEPEDDWQELLDLAENVPIEVAYVFRHDPCVAFIQEQLANGRLGRIIEADFYCGSWLPDWRPGIDYRSSVSARRDQGGGALLEISHEIDLAQLFFGALSLEAAFCQNSGVLQLDVEDQAILVARSVTGCLVTIRLNFCTNPAERKMIVRGSSGQLSWDLISGKVYESLPNVVCRQIYTSSVSADQRYLLQLQHFWGYVGGHSNSKCALSDGLNALNLVVRARQKCLGSLD